MLEFPGTDGAEHPAKRFNLSVVLLHILLYERVPLGNQEAGIFFLHQIRLCYQSPVGIAS